MNSIVRHILIADDHSIIRVGLRFILNSQFNVYKIDEVSDKKGLFEALSNKQYSHLILDLQLQHYHALVDVPALRKQYPDLMILIYSMSQEEVLGKRLLKMGVNGFLSKLSAGSELKKALNLFLSGRNYVSDNLREALQNKTVRFEPKQNPFDELSVQEMTVVIYLILGKRSKDIASVLQLKSTTIATYKARIYNKLKVKNLMELQNLGKIYELDVPVLS